VNEELSNIIANVRCLYLKYGIKSVSMDDVARELGISKKTLYQYVSEKAELVKLVINSELEDKIDIFNKIQQRDLNAIDELVEVNRFLTDINNAYSPTVDYDLKKFYPEVYKQLKNVKREKMLQFISSNLEKGKNQGLYREDLNSEIIAKLHVSRVESIIDNDIFSIEELTSPAMFNEVFYYHLRGICNVNGIKYLEKVINELKTNNNE
jgi:TetR/AcrR family transcriptional regulator, cholesterol catabolism regulator